MKNNKKTVADEITTMQITRGVLQEMRVLASLEGQTLLEWITWMVDKAYQSRIRSLKK